MNMAGTASPYRTRTARARTASPIELTLLVAVIVVLFAAAWLSGRTTVSEIHTRSVRVVPGETLWSIARSNPTPGLSTAESVRVLAEINGLEDATVVAGAVLQVPAGDAAFDRALALR